MRNKIVTAIATLVVLILVWYLFIKQSDYTVTFKVKANTSIVVDAIVNWGDDLEKKEEINVVTWKDSLFSKITQQVKKQDSSYVLTWNIKAVNDSLSYVKVNILEKSHSLKNRLLVPFVNAPIEKFAVNSMIDFNKGFQKYFKSYRIKLNGEDNVPDAFCACKSANSTQNEKAVKMLQLNMDIMTYLRKNSINIKGKPYLQVTSWNREKENITFDFCFPIEKNDSLPLLENGVFYKEIKAVLAIKATYNGNYRDSDRTWNYLINHSKNKNIKVQQLPTELFFNDPQQGGDELNWKAEIFMPILK